MSLTKKEPAWVSNDIVLNLPKVDSVKSESTNRHTLKLPKHLLYDSPNRPFSVAKEYIKLLQGVNK